MSNFNHNSTCGGLGTVESLKVPDAGMYFVDGKLSLPSIPAGSSSASQVVAVINKNGSPQYTGNAGARGFHAEISCAAGDILSVVLSSSAGVDNEKNAVSTTTSIGIK